MFNVTRIVETHWLSTATEAELRHIILAAYVAESAQARTYIRYCPEHGVRAGSARYVSLCAYCSGCFIVINSRIASHYASYEIAHLLGHKHEIVQNSLEALFLAMGVNTDKVLQV